MTRLQPRVNGRNESVIKSRVPVRPRKTEKPVRVRSNGLTQKQTVLNHFLNGNGLSYTKCLELYGIKGRSFARILCELRQEGYPLVSEAKETKHHSVYINWKMDFSGDLPEGLLGPRFEQKPQASPSLFDHAENPSEAAAEETVTAQEPVPEEPPQTVPEVIPEATPEQTVKAVPEINVWSEEDDDLIFETLAHHVANPDDQKQIYATFREYCDRTHGRKVLIDPGMARELLKLNWKGNRNLRRNYVRELAREIKAGWKYINAQLAFDEEHRLLDGQHRLSACVYSNLPFRTDVAFDIDSDAYLVIDRNRVKTAGDIAKYEGVEKNHTAHAGAAAILYRYDKGYEIQAVLTSTERQESLHMYPALYYWVGLAKTLAYNRKKLTGLRGSAAVIASTLYLCARINPDLAYQFAQELKTGEGLMLRHPSTVTRVRINSERPTFWGHHDGFARLRTAITKGWEYRNDPKAVEKGIANIQIVDGVYHWPKGSRRPVNDHQWPEPAMNLFPSHKISRA